MFPTYINKMVLCGYEMEKDKTLGKKLKAILSVSYIKQRSFKVKYHIVVLSNDRLNFNPTVVTFFFGMFIFLSQLFLGGSLLSSKIHFFSLEPPVENVLNIPLGGDIQPWKLGSKFHVHSKSSKSKLSRSLKFLRRRLLVTPGSLLSSGSASTRSQSLVKSTQQKYKKSKITVNSVARKDENGEIKITYNSSIIEEQENLAKKRAALHKNSKLVEDLNISRDGSLKLEKKNKLTREAKTLDSLTRNRRLSPLIKNGFRDSNKNFYPVYTTEQI
jgi:hypothetical protein